MLKNKTIINWPSGASGDFLLSMAMILTGNKVVWAYDTNQWNCNITSDPALKTVRDFTDDTPWWENITNYNLVLTHIFPTLIEDKKIISNDIPDDYTIINIDNEYHELFTNVLYIMKSDYGIQEDGPISHLDQSALLKLFFRHPGFVNISYHEIFFKQNEDTIKKLYKHLLDRDLTEEELTEIVRCIKFYHMIGYNEMEELRYSEIGQNRDSMTPGLNLIELTSLEQIGGYYD